MVRVIGQQHAMDLLQRQLASGRLHHAWIFHGPVGVGKFTAAMAFAQVLLCHDRQTDLVGAVSACGVCPSCGAIGVSADAAKDDEAQLAAAHPDLRVVSKELARYHDDARVRNQKLRNLPVDVIRTHLIEPAGRRPQMADGRFGKVFVVDEAELLAREGQNAMLKTLEEPPAGTTIILVTSSEDRLLPTIRSRCQRVAFVPIADAEVARWIGQRPGGPDDARQVQWLVDFAGGSLGRAMLAMDYGLVDWAREILQAMRRMASGRPVGDLGPKLAAMIGGFADLWVKRHANASKDAANRLGAALCFGIITTEARRMLAEAAERCDPEDPLVADALTGPAIGVIEAVAQTQGDLARNVNLGLACDGLALAINAALTAGAPVA